MQSSVHLFRFIYKILISKESPNLSQHLCQPYGQNDAVFGIYEPKRNELFQNFVFQNRNYTLRIFFCDRTQLQVQICNWTVLNDALSYTLQKHNVKKIMSPQSKQAPLINRDPF